MTGMLASVSNCFEVEKLLSADIDIIDLKDPVQGALGAVPCAVAGEIVNLVNHRRLVSATVGDITDIIAIDMAISSMGETGVDFIKVGIFSTELPEELPGVLKKHAAAGIDIVLVFFADVGYTTQSFNMLAEAGIKGVMLDTADKESGSLTSILERNRLKQFVSVAHQYGLVAGLAGSLQEKDIAELLPLNPDYLGFRGAICHKRNRTMTIDLEAVKRIRKLIPGQAAEISEIRTAS